MVPSPSGEPLSGSDGGCGKLDALLHVVERGAADQVDGELGAPAFAEMEMRVVKARHDEGSGEVDFLGRWSGELQSIVIAGRGDDFSLADDEGGDKVRLGCAGGLFRRKGLKNQPFARQDMAVEIDGVRCGICVLRRHKGRDGAGKQNGQQKFHARV